MERIVASRVRPPGFCHHFAAHEHLTGAAGHGGPINGAVVGNPSAADDIQPSDRNPLTSVGLKVDRGGRRARVGNRHGFSIGSSADINIIAGLGHIGRLLDREERIGQ